MASQTQIRRANLKDAEQTVEDRFQGGGNDLFIYRTVLGPSCR
jgi:hypothetical protein